ncbi:MAG: tryptophan-rich sensory protein [Oscillospiraceae bacterium]|jgi:tryptophan-rich sensory protein|nr:tryptophan-rich sensory protein [Oscillospiraceae bacterium]
MEGKQAVRFYLASAAAGLLASLFTLRMGEAFAALKLPFLFPPLWLLPIGWTVALILLASSVRVSGDAKTITSFYVSLGLMVCWAALFFRAGAIPAAAITGLLLTGVWLHMRRLLGQPSPQGKKLMLPCCIWSGYLAYLNLGIWLMNLE